MKFLLDHDVPDDAGFALAAMGHEVLKLRELLPVTTPDDEVLRLAGERGALLLTGRPIPSASSMNLTPHPLPEPKRHPIGFRIKGRDDEAGMASRRER